MESSAIKNEWKRLNSKYSIAKKIADSAKSVYNAARDLVSKLGDEPTQEDVESATIEIDRLFAQDDEFNVEAGWGNWTRLHKGIG